MASNIATLNVKLTASIGAFASTMANAGKPLAAFGSKVASVSSKVAALSTAIGGGALATGVTGLGICAVKLAAEAEQARVSFTTMLGSAEKAKQLQAEINSFAASTPFQTTELIDASKKLLAFGVAQDQVIPSMRTLGDLAAGLGVPLGDLAEIYGKARVQGRLMAEDINQLTGRGIPVIQQFAKQFGVTEGEVRGLVEQGKIGFPQLQKALVDLTSEGGQFGGMMKAQSATLAGLYSTLQDSVTLSLTRVGEIITDKLDLRAAIGGIGEALGTLATATMPIIETLLGRLTEGGNIGQRAGTLVMTGAEMMATGLAYVIDYSSLVVAGFKLLQAGAALAIGGLLKAVDLLGSGMVKLLNLLPGVELQWSETIGAMADGVLEEAATLRDAAGDAFNKFQTSDSANKVSRFFDQIRRNAQQSTTAMEGAGKAAQQTALKIEQAAAGQSAKVLQTLATLKKETETAGLNDQQKKLTDLSAAGATGQQLTQARAMLEVQKQIGKLSEINTGGGPLTDFAARMEQLQKLYAAGKVTADQFASIRDNVRTTLADKLTEQAKSITEGVKSPLEAYQEELVNLNVMLERGLITQQTFDRASAKAQATFNNSGETTAPDAIQAGSAAAARFAFDMNRGSQKITRDEIQKKALAEAEEHTKLLQQVAQNTRSSAAAPEEVGI